MKKRLEKYIIAELEKLKLSRLDNMLTENELKYLDGIEAVLIGIIEKFDLDIRSK